MVYLMCFTNLGFYGLLVYSYLWFLVHWCRIYDTTVVLVAGDPLMNPVYHCLSTFSYATSHLPQKTVALCWSYAWGLQFHSCAAIDPWLWWHLNAWGLLPCRELLIYNQKRTPKLSTMSFHIWVAHCGSKAGRCDERREERRKLQLGSWFKHVPGNWPWLRILRWSINDNSPQTKPGQY